MLPDCGHGHVSVVDQNFLIYKKASFRDVMRRSNSNLACSNFPDCMLALCVCSLIACAGSRKVLFVIAGATSSSTHRQPIVPHSPQMPVYYICPSHGRRRQRLLSYRHVEQSLLRSIVPWASLALIAHLPHHLATAHIVFVSEPSS
jgi:hypothetical protein